MERITEQQLQSEGLKNHWKALHARSELRDLGNSYEWATHWWTYYKHFGAGTKELLVLMDGRNGQPNGICPLMIRRILGFRSVEFVGQSGGHITDYVGPVGHVEWRRVLEYLYEDVSSWDVVSLALAPGCSTASDIARAATMARGMCNDRWRLDVADLLVRLYLPTDFDAYLGQLGRKTRQHVRRYIRRSCDVGSQLDILTGRAIRQGLPRLYALNSENWSVFLHQRDRDFMSNTLGDFQEEDGPFLAVLSIAGEVRATILGFRARDVCYLHPAGVRRQDVQGISPGTLMHALLIQEMIASGVKVIDLSPGVEEYKLRLGGTVEPLLRITMWHRRTRRLNCWLARNFRRVYRALRAWRPLGPRPSVSRDI